MQAFFLILVRLLAICLMILAGYVARKRGIMNGDTTTAMSKVLILFIYPAMIYSSLVGNYSLREVLARWPLPVGGFCIMLLGFLIGIFAVKLLKGYSEKTKRSFRFQVTMNNYTFMPLPLVMQMYGDGGVATLLLASAGGEFALWTLGIISISGGFRLKHLKNMLNPPFIAIWVALATLALGEYAGVHVDERTALWNCCASLISTMKIFGGATIPLSMLTAGSKIAELNCRKLFQSNYAWLIAVRLMLVPAICLALLKLLPLEPQIARILWLMAVMPSPVSSVAYADVFDADGEAAAAGVLVTHVACIATIPLWFCIF